MTPRITIVGGGSTHWTRGCSPTSPTPARCTTLPSPWSTSTPTRCRRCSTSPTTWRSPDSGLGLAVSATTDLEAGLDGAEYVVTAFSVGGFASMRHDLEIPARYGIRQPVGDSVGPGGITRALRSIPVLVGIATAVERRCPDALLLNVTNPLSALCRAVTRETGVRTIGLCNEVVGLQFVTSLLLDADLRRVDPVVAGVNHLPLVTSLDVDGEDGFARLRALLDDEAAQAEPVWMTPPDGMHYRKVSPGSTWTKADVIAGNRLKLELFRPVRCAARLLGHPRRRVLPRLRHARIRLRTRVVGAPLRPRGSHGRQAGRRAGCRRAPGQRRDQPPPVRRARRPAARLAAPGCAAAPADQPAQHRPSPEPRRRHRRRVHRRRCRRNGAAARLGPGAVDPRRGCCVGSPSPKS